MESEMGHIYCTGCSRVDHEKPSWSMYGSDMRILKFHAKSYQNENFLKFMGIPWVGHNALISSRYGVSKHIRITWHDSGDDFSFQSESNQTVRVFSGIQHKSSLALCLHYRIGSLYSSCVSLMIMKSLHWSHVCHIILEKSANISHNHSHQERKEWKK